MKRTTNNEDKELLYHSISGGASCVIPSAVLSVFSDGVVLVVLSAVMHLVLIG
jgi:hypothetical protein